MLAAALLSAALAALSPQEPTADVPELLARLEERLRSHPYIGRIAYRRVDDFAPFYFYVKRPDGDDSGYYARVAADYGPWFRELERQFVERYVGPLKLTRRADRRFYPIFVLDSRGAYEDYADAARATELHDARAHYDVRLGVAVTFENAYQLESRSEHRRAALHELVHALQHAYFADALRLPDVAWFNEGLAGYLSYCEGLLPPALDEKMPDRDALQLVAVLANVDGALQSGLFPLEELVTFRDYAEVEERVRARGGGVELTVAGSGIALPLFYAQSSLWTYFLHHGDGERHREAYLSYAGSVWRGDGGAAALRHALEGADLAALDHAFRQWLKRTISERLHLTASIPLEPASATAGGGAENPAPAASAPFVPAELLPDTADVGAVFALTLAEAQRGALAAAEERLRALTAMAPEPMRPRIERELERVSEFRALRRRFFEHIAKPGARKLDATIGGQKLVAQVTGLEGERVHLGTNKRGLEALQLDELPNVLVAELARDKKYGFEAGPAAAWAFALEGDERWKKLVPAGDPLRTDAEDYPERLALGRAASLLAFLAESGARTDAATVEAALAAIGRLLREFDALALVVKKRPGLRALARSMLASQFEQGGLAASLGGRFEDLGGGRVRLTYAFDALEELRDFQQIDYLSSAANGRTRADFLLGNGRLSASGYACLRSRLAFEGEQRVRCRASYAVPGGSYDPRIVFRLGLNDDGLLSFAAADLSGALAVIDLPQNYVKQSPGAGQIVLGETYTLELAFDGADVVSSVNGRPGARASTGPRRSGGVFLLTSADLGLNVEELVLEGTPSPGSVALLRDGWIEERLAELGFE